MKNLSKLFLLTSLLLLSFTFADEPKVSESKFSVSGNCGMCKTRIEEAVKIKEVKYASWNKNSKILKVMHEETISVDSLKHRLAEVGHDTDKYKSSEKVYKSLPKCCLYRDNPKTH